MKNTALAQEVTSGNFIQPELVEKVLGVGYSQTDYDYLRQKNSLDEWFHRQFESNHSLLIPGPPGPLSLVNVIDHLHEKKLDHLIDFPDNWGAREGVAFPHNQMIHPGWFAFCKQPRAESLGKNWHDQQYAISMLEYIPSVVEVVWALLVSRLVCNEFLFQREFVRTLSRTQDNQHVLVGGNDSSGIRIIGGYDSDCKPNIGCAVCLKVLL